MEAERSDWARKYSAGITAQRNGILKKAKEVKCEKCGVTASDRHHEDYSRPLEVTFFCKKCHFARHKELGWGIGGRTPETAFYNFARIPVGAFAFIDKATVFNISPLVHHFRNRQKLHMTFKCFAFGTGVVVFRTK